MVAITGKIVDYPRSRNERSDYVLANPNGVAHISVDGYVTYAGMIKQPSLPNSDSIELTFDGHATGTLPNHAKIPHLRVVVYPDDGELRSEIMINSSQHYYGIQYVLTSNDRALGWQDISFDLTDHAGQDVIIFIGLYDGWSANWQLTASVDNIIIPAE